MSCAHFYALTHKHVSNDIYIHAYVCTLKSKNQHDSSKATDKRFDCIRDMLSDQRRFRFDVHFGKLSMWLWNFLLLEHKNSFGSLNGDN